MKFVQRNSKMKKQKIVQDKGFAWIILVITFTINMIETSIYMSPAIYMVAWDMSFDVTKAQLGTTGALLNGVAVAAGIIAGPVISKIGCRPPTLAGTLICAAGLLATVFATSIEWIYITYGVITGIGLGFLGLPSIIYIQYYFNRKRPFALGMSMAGQSIGAFTSVALLQYVIELYGWRNTMLLHTGLLLQVMVLGSFFKPVDIPESQNEKAATEKGDIDTIPKLDDNHANKIINIDNSIADNQALTSKYKAGSQNGLNENGLSTHQQSQEHKRSGDSILRKITSFWKFSLLKNKAFLMFVINMTVIEYGCGTYYKFTPIRVINDGLSAQNAAFIFSCIGVMSLTFRIIISVVANLPKVNRSVISGCAVLGMALVSFASCAAYDFKTYAICSLLFGVCLGSFASSVFTVMTDIVGVTNVAQAFSLLAAFQSISMFTGGPLAGFIIDVSGSYDLVFTIYGATLLIPGLLFLFMSCIFPHLNFTNTNTLNDKEEKGIASTDLKDFDNANACSSSVSLNKIV